MNPERKGIVKWPVTRVVVRRVLLHVGPPVVALVLATLLDAQLLDGQLLDEAAHRLCGLSSSPHSLRLCRGLTCMD